MGAVDDAKKYLSLRPPMENKTIFALHPDVLVAGLLDEIDRLRRANKVQACTIRSLQYSKSKIVYEAHIAVKTFDSEKEANAILTDEIERQQKALQWIAGCKGGDIFDMCKKMRDTAKAALKEGEVSG